MTRVKVCGITNLEGGRAALEGGADYLGFVFYPPSIRLVTPRQAADLIKALLEAKSQGWQAVGVFVNEPIEIIQSILELGVLDIVQLNGEESREYIRQIPLPTFKAVRVGGEHHDGQEPRPEDFGAERLLVDASVPGRYGGTGVTYDWAEVRPIVRDGFLAGGLTPDNVGHAIATAMPWGVDVSSGVEQDGLKSPSLIHAFLDAVHAADAAFIR
jgi:phosphoribosylanthranilate isomerase